MPIIRVTDSDNKPDRQAKLVSLPSQMTKCCSLAWLKYTAPPTTDPNMAFSGN
ncbi:hypothetical protein [Bartonella heixiaziensis]|uniref:hypothetical protein n=1 Tax=Bartonella heixiaziensis TaxID=1461000 RepID=UPI003D259418